LLHRYLNERHDNSNDETLRKILKQQKRYNTLLTLISLLLLGIAAWEILRFYSQ